MRRSFCPWPICSGRPQSTSASGGVLGLPGYSTWPEYKSLPLAGKLVARDRRLLPRLPRLRPTTAGTIAAVAAHLRLSRARTRIEGEMLVLLDLFFLSLSLWFAVAP